MNLALNIPLDKKSLTFEEIDELKIKRGDTIEFKTRYSQMRSLQGIILSVKKHWTTTKNQDKVRVFKIVLSVNGSIAEYDTFYEIKKEG